MRYERSDPRSIRMPGILIRMTYGTGENTHSLLLYG